MLDYLPGAWQAPWAIQPPLHATRIDRPFGDV